MTETLVSRRQMLRAGAVGGLNLAVSGVVTARMDPNRRLGGGAAEKSCILVWLCGGPSHLDTWDLKPDAPEGIRGHWRRRRRPDHPGQRAGGRDIAAPSRYPFR
jgi:uncharacterized protein DUF1501